MGSRTSYNRPHGKAKKRWTNPGSRWERATGRFGPPLRTLPEDGLLSIAKPSSKQNSRKLRNRKLKEKDIVHDNLCQQVKRIQYSNRYIQYNRSDIAPSNARRSK